MDIRYYCRQLRTLPPWEVLKRGGALVGTKISVPVKALSARIFNTTLSDEDFLKTAFNASPVSPTVLRGLYTNKRSLFFVNAEEEKAAPPAGSTWSRAESEKILIQADRICEHEFDLFASGNIRLGEKIDWHCDFKTAYRWNQNRYFRNIETPYGVADVKTPWELSRFSHAVTLGQAYRLTKDEKYAREFLSQVSDWINTNKPQFGVNWACTMDVAIRACNWIVASSFFRYSPEITDDFLMMFTKSLYQHGLHIFHNLENKNCVINNHFVANLAGLTYLGVSFPELHTSRRWREFGIEGLKTEMRKQVYPDGCDFEASTCYHRLVLELFFFPTLAAVVNDDRFTGSNHADVCRAVFGDAYADRLHRMFKAVLYLLKPNGRMPQIGDNDSGRLHVFADRDVLDMRYLLTLGAIFFKEPIFKVREFGFCGEALWIFGVNGWNIWEGLSERSLADVGSIAFPNAGWYIMRNNRDYLMMSCGPNGQNGAGGHAHNDKLSFELCINGEDAVVDPGTGVYTSDPAARNLFRSTSMHSTVMVDGREQNCFTASPLSLFRMDNDAAARILSWSVSDEIDVFIGEHRGYAKLPSPVIHQREIRFHKKTRAWEIIDRFNGGGEHTFEWNFILPPERSKKISIASDRLLIRTEPMPYSPGYGIRTMTSKLTCSATATSPCEYSFMISGVIDD